jgi:hypothetical protein
LLHVNGMLVEDWFSKVLLKRHGDDLNGYHSICIENLEQGRYELRFLSGLKWHDFNINVHKGQPWGQNGFILKKDALRENMQFTNIPKVSDIKITPGEKNQCTVEVTVDDVISKTDTGKNAARLHAFAH